MVSYRFLGSYTCIRLQSCGTGYTLNAETGQCDDDDECALGSHNCQVRKNLFQMLQFGINVHLF